MVKNIRKREQQDEMFSETAYDLISKKGAGLAEVTTKPATDIGTRTTTQNSTQGGDILRDV